MSDKTKWFIFNQNNSGGSFKLPAIMVYVEAFNAQHANNRAELLGLYFDGGGDCTCCGNRWDEASDFNSVEEEPMDASAREPWMLTQKGIPTTIKLGINDIMPVHLPTKTLNKYNDHKNQKK